MSDELREQLINDYLNKTLSKDKYIEFSKQMLSDPILAEDVRIQKNLYALFETEKWEDINVLNDDGIAYESFLLSDECSELMKSIHEANTQYKRVSLSPRKINFIKYAAVACIALVLSTASFLMFNSNQTSTELYASYNNFDLPSLTLRSDADKLLADAEHSFLQKDYNATLNTIALYENSYDNDLPTVILYKGLSHLELNHYDDAIKYLEEFKNGDYLDSNKAYWYLALANLKQNNIKTTKSILNTIVSNSYFNHEKANQLLHKLK